ncbi:MAG: hypothetical protein AAF682_10315 [Planctomycetota bacterium]
MTTHTEPTNPSTDTLEPAERDEVRRQVRGLLERAESFRELDPRTRRELAANLVQVASYMADPVAGLKDAPDATRAPLAAAQAKKDENKTPRTGLVGQEFVGGAAREAGDAFRNLVDSVDFTSFVSGLIEGVFTSIVDSSIRQMQEYARFLEAVVKSVNDFAMDNVSANEARDHLTEKYPSVFEIDADGDEPSMKLKDDVDEDALPNFADDLGFEGELDLGEPEIEQALVQSARLDLARMRQQQLSTMVLMGINRIVVTDGLINAKVVFDVESEDTATRTTATSYDRRSRTDRRKSSSEFWGTGSQSTRTRVTTRNTRENTTESDARLETKAKLTGEVRVNFKSDYFPLERIASPNELTAVEENSKR